MNVGDIKTVRMVVKGMGGRGELTVNDLMLLREGSDDVWREACRVWDEAINAHGSRCHWHNKQGKCVGTAGTTIVTHKGSQGNLGYASPQALVQALAQVIQGVRP
jgi:hypothetical protein